MTSDLAFTLLQRAMVDVITNLCAITYEVEAARAASTYSDLMEVMQTEKDPHVQNILFTMAEGCWQAAAVWQAAAAMDA